MTSVKDKTNGSIYNKVSIKQTLYMKMDVDMGKFKFKFVLLGMYSL